jgi:hypothetical protein
LEPAFGTGVGNRGVKNPGEDLLVRLPVEPT